MKFLKEGYKEYIYLVPELVSLTGLTEQQKADFRLMKNLSEFTKLTAQERMKETKKMLGFLQGGKEELMF
jgi:aubergine-like protein